MQSQRSNQAEIFTWIEFVRNVMVNEDLLRDGDPDRFSDEVFKSEMNKSIKEAKQYYNSMKYREAFHYGFKKLQISVEKYKLLSIGKMNRQLLMKFIDVQTILVAPIHPVMSEYVWRLLEKPTSVMYAGWPQGGPVNEVLMLASIYVMNISERFKKKLKKLKNKVKANQQQTMKMKDCVINVTNNFSNWQKNIIELLHWKYNQGVNPFAHCKRIIAELQKLPQLRSHKQKVSKFMMSLKRLTSYMDVENVLSRTMPFDEYKVVTENVDFLTNMLQVDFIEVKLMPEDMFSNNEYFPGHPSLEITFESRLNQNSSF